MKYKYLLFDADNTLFDFDTAEKQAFLSLNALCRNAFDAATYRLYHEINDSLWKSLESGRITRDEIKNERFRIYLDACGVKCSKGVIDGISKAYMLALGRQTELISGAAETLPYLSRRYKIYIITNGVSRVQRPRFNASKIKEYVTDIFISEEIGYNKPDSAYFESVMAHIGDPDRESYLVIGDSLSSDILGANNACLDSIHYDPRGIGHDGFQVNCAISDLTELMKIL